MVPPQKLADPQPWHQFCPVVSLWAKTAVGPVALPEHYLSVLGILSSPMIQYAICGLAAAHVHFLKGHINREFESSLAQRPMLIDCLYYQGKAMEELNRHLTGQDDFIDLCNLMTNMCLLVLAVRQVIVFKFSFHESSALTIQVMY